MEIGERLLVESADALQVDLISAMLEDEGIPFYIKTLGPGSYYNSGALFGFNVYVAAAGYGRAKEFVDTYLS